MDKDFNKIGKDSHYSVPDGFFEQVSELTLIKAKQRENKHRKIQIVLRGFAVAASLSAIALLGYFMTNPEKQEVRQFVKQEQHDASRPNRQKEVKGEQIPSSWKKRVAEGKPIVREIKHETLSDVLPDLTDDELLQMAVLYRTDPFIDENQN
jgi:proline dehydrogenase